MSQFFSFFFNQKMHWFIPICHFWSVLKKGLYLTGNKECEIFHWVSHLHHIVMLVVTFIYILIFLFLKQPHTLVGDARIHIFYGMEFEMWSNLKKNFYEKTNNKNS